MFKVTDPIGQSIEYTCLKFSGGEIQPKITKWHNFSNPITITANLTDSDKNFELALLVDAFRRMSPDVKINLVMPYLPYARQDRVMTPGESLAVKVMANFINSLNFNSVEVWDCHSDVGLALLDRVTNIGPEKLLQKFSDISFQHTILVAPDAGAIKKVSKVAKNFNLKMISAGKSRDVNTGAITGTIVYSENLGDTNLLMVDDLSDGGATFIYLAKELRKITTGKINLYVTHGIFSKGLDVFNGVIDHIYTANPFPNVDLTNPIISIIETQN